MPSGKYRPVIENCNRVQTESTALTLTNHNVGKFPALCTAKRLGISSNTMVIKKKLTG